MLTNFKPANAYKQREQLCDIPTHIFRYNLLRGCPNAKTVTLILRGGAEQFIEETERSLHDAIMIVRRALKVFIS